MSAFGLLLKSLLLFQCVVRRCGVLCVIGEWIFESGDASLFYNHKSLNFKDEILTFTVDRLTVYRFLVLVDGLFRISFTFL